ncbi:DUF4493 domain-containing protein [Bacteroides sp.]|uniref:DUF4493 domain-containing protein n=1 Tax=Bacteroides sp. TaxID=29523 RepID=UPI002A802DD0|nr:DUF4493 domain-containing protein [Bacteroides sp.]
MKGILKFILFLEIVLLCSCVNDENRSGAFGGMSLHLSANSSVTDVTTRSSEEVLPSIQDFSISMLQGDKVQASWDKLSDYDEDTTFPVGSYTLKAFYGDIEKEGFDSPYYEGTTDFNIRGGETTPVETTCKLANTKISIEYTDDFKQYFKTYSSTVQAELGSEVSFSSGETRAAYVKPGRISVKLTFTKVNGGLSPTTVEVATIEEALAQHHYHLQMNVDAGKAMLSIVFDRVTEVRPITLDISDKALNIKPPYFTLTGFEKTSNDGNQWDGNPIESNQLSALLTSLGGFTKCILRTTSPNLPDWPEEGFNLAALTPEDQALLDKSGVKLIGFGINQDQMGIINFTGLIPNLNITDNNDTHLFYLSATSTYGKQSEDYVLNITTPKNFMLLPTDPVKMKSKEVTIPVKLKEGNPQNIKLYYRYYGVMTLINNTVITPIEGKEGYYNIKASGIDMGVVAKDFQAEYNGLKSAIVSVAVIIPSYSVILEPFHVWSYTAEMTIVPEYAEDMSNVMSAIEAYISLNGSTWTKVDAKDLKLDATTGKAVISGLTPGTAYYFRTTCDDGTTYSIPVMQATESVVQLPDFTQGWANYFNETINKGGGYGYSGILGSSKKQDTRLLTIEDLNDTWAVVNQKTAPTNPKTKNTWYIVASAFNQNTGVMLRNVAWSDKLGDPPSKYGSVSWSATTLNDLTPPTHEHRSAGKLFLGSYSYNHSTNVEIYNEGISFTSRPIKLKGTYTYVANNDQGGIVTVIVENREGGQTLKLAEGSEVLTATSSQKEFTVDLTYNTMFEKKATHLRVMFASSSNASNTQSVEDNKIKTTDNKGEAISTGSELYIDKNIILEYK